MVKLSDDDVQTKEVLDWRGLNLFHFSHSTCSQKLRIFLKLKGLDWTSHHLDLARKKHHTAWYMGVNPRGLAPTLVHDGQVIIESNDILAHLEAAFPDPPLIPDGGSETTAAPLKAEDDLPVVQSLRGVSLQHLAPRWIAQPLPEADNVDATS
ncbi:MAG: glutathione S-transferase N-terminal domain-containing protein [Pseudomonadota bacterium]